MLKWAKFFRKIQKPLIIVAAIVTVASLVYALMFSTDILLLDLFSDKSRPKRYIEGAEIYQNAQGFNQMLLNLSIVYILAGIALLVFFNQTRRKYYLSNYITSSAYSAVALFMGVFTLVNVIGFRADFMKIDMVRYAELAKEYGLRIATSPIIFDIGIIISVLYVIAAAFVLINMIVKMLAMKEERRLKKSNPEEFIYE